MMDSMTPDPVGAFEFEAPPIGRCALSAQVTREGSVGLGPAVPVELRPGASVHVVLRGPTELVAPPRDRRVLLQAEQEAADELDRVEELCGRAEELVAAGLDLPLDGCSELQREAAESLGDASRAVLEAEP